MLAISDEPEPLGLGAAETPRDGKVNFLQPRAHFVHKFLDNGERCCSRPEDFTHQPRGHVEQGSRIRQHFARAPLYRLGAQADKRCLK
jgi:hypothetical protein